MAERHIGGYKVVRLLGKGGMSEVYEVERPVLGSRHALKLFTYDKDDGDVRGRFLVEGRLLAKLNHPRIVRVTDIGTDESCGRPYFVMDLVLDRDGRTCSLADVGAGTVDEETVGRWYDDLRDGLEYIHARGVIHRDLKLQNVLLGPDGHAVLTDFGISKVFDAKGDGKAIVDTVQTIVKMREGRGLVMGSIGYMAPELEMGVAASPQSDWYALGVIVYKMLTGTWCDARTDVVSVLASYDPVWRRIIPKLLHSNPNGRECLSYAEERRADLERNEAAWEERWLREKERGHLARHVARYVGSALVVAGLSIAFILVRNSGERARLENELRAKSALRVSPYSFDELFRIPSEVGDDEKTDESGNVLYPSRDNLDAARVDALVITHDLFSRMESGDITPGRLCERLESLQESFSENSDRPFNDWPAGYLQTGSDEDLAWLLSRAVEKLEALNEK